MTAWQQLKSHITDIADFLNEIEEGELAPLIQNLIEARSFLDRNYPSSMENQVEAIERLVIILNKLDLMTSKLFLDENLKNYLTNV